VNPAHLHLMVNHIPVLGTVFVALLLAWALYRGSAELTRVGLAGGVLVAALTYPVFLTGEPAENSVEDAPWLQESRVHEHEERAEAGLIAVVITGLIAAVALWQGRGGRPLPRGLAGLSLAGLVLSAGLFAWTALAGGVIRHDEIRGPGAAAGASATEQDDGD
jgi:hypothetical protein